MWQNTLTRALLKQRMPPSLHAFWSWMMTALYHRPYDRAVGAFL